MAESLALSLLLQAKDEASKPLKTFSNTLSDVGKVALGVFGGAALVSGIKAVGNEIGLMVKESMQLPDVSRRFTNLADSIGETSDVMMRDLRAAVKGTVSDFDLMQQGNKLMGMGLAASSEEAAKLAKIAYELGEPTLDVTTNMENLALMLANQSIPRLDSFNISSGATRKRMEELTAANEGMSRETAFMTAFMEQAEASMERVGSREEDLSVITTQMKVQWQNFRMELGSAVLPALAELLGLVKPLADAALPAISQILTGSVVPAITQAASVVQTLANYFAFTVEEGDELNDYLADLPSWMQPVIEIFGAAIVRAGDLRQWWDTHFSYVRDMVQDKMESVQTTIQDVMTAVWAFLEPLIQQITDWWRENYELIQQTTRTVLDTIHNIITTVLSAVRDFWREHGDEIRSITNTVWAAIQTIISTTLDLVLGIITATMQVINGDWRSAWQTIYDALKKFWEDMRDKIIIPLLKEITDKITDEIDRVKEWILTQVAKWRQVGADLLNGLRQGVVDAAGRFVQQVIDTVLEALRRAKEALGISSPSKKFAEVGESMAQGIEAGWTSAFASTEERVLADMQFMLEKVQAAQGQINSAFGGFTVGGGAIGGGPIGPGGENLGRSGGASDAQLAQWEFERYWKNPALQRRLYGYSGDYRKPGTGTLMEEALANSTPGFLMPEMGGLTFDAGRPESGNGLPYLTPEERGAPYYPVYDRDMPTGETERRDSTKGGGTLMDEAIYPYDMPTGETERRDSTKVVNNYNLTVVNGEGVLTEQAAVHTLQQMEVQARLR